MIGHTSKSAAAAAAAGKKDGRKPVSGMSRSRKSAASEYEGKKGA